VDHCGGQMSDFLGEERTTSEGGPYKVLWVLTVLRGLDCGVQVQFGDHVVQDLVDAD